MHLCPTALPDYCFISPARWMRWWAVFATGMALQAAGMASSGGSIYLIGQDTDRIHLSDRPQGPDPRLLVGLASEPPQATASAPKLPKAPAAAARTPLAARGTTPDRQLADIVHQAAVSNGIEPELLTALIAVESGHVARAVSPRGAQGLMQLMPATAREYGVVDPFDPRQNVAAGALHLRRLLDRFGQDKTLALAAYNAGPGAVVRHHGRIPPYAETTAYVPRVLQRFAALQRESQSAAPPQRAFP